MGVAQALDGLHRRGEVCGGLRPDTVELDGNTPVLLPAGSDPEAPGEPWQAAYVAPEVHAGGRPDARSDLFALGVLVHEMATGRIPFVGATVADVTRAIRAGRFVGLDEHEPMAPPSLTRLLATCLAPDADERWQSARDFGRELGWTGALDEPAPERLEDDSRASPATLYGVIGLAAGIVLSGAWRACG